jgi:hypothetical protein
MGDVKIGDSTITIGGFSVFKAAHVAQKVGAVLDAVPNLTKDVEQFRASFSSENPQRMARAAVELRYPDTAGQISEEAWQASADANGKQYLELPGEPSGLDVATYLVPKLLNVATNQLLDLLAIIAVPNRELEAADRDGKPIDDLIAETKGKLQHEDASVLLDIAREAGEALKAQFAGRGDDLRPILEAIGFNPEALTSEDQSKSTTPSEQSSSSPTDSDAATDGDSTRSPTDSPSPAPALSTSD